MDFAIGLQQFADETHTRLNFTTITLLFSM